MRSARRAAFSPKAKRASESYRPPPSAKQSSTLPSSQDRPSGKYTALCTPAKTFRNPQQPCLGRSVGCGLILRGQLKIDVEQLDGAQLNLEKAEGEKSQKGQDRKSRPTMEGRRAADQEEIDQPEKGEQHQDRTRYVERRGALQQFLHWAARRRQLAEHEPLEGLDRDIADRDDGGRDAVLLRFSICTPIHRPETAGRVTTMVAGESGAINR